jgi:hypothetical protein
VKILHRVVFEFEDVFDLARCFQTFDDTESYECGQTLTVGRAL